MGCPECNGYRKRHKNFCSKKPENIKRKKLSQWKLQNLLFSKKYKCYKCGLNRSIHKGDACGHCIRNS